MSEYRYPASRNFDPTKVEDLGSLPPAALTAESVKPQAGGLAKLKRTVPVHQQPQKQEQATLAQGASKQSLKKRGRKKGPALHVTSVRLPQSLKQEVLDYRRETGLSKGLVILRAIESCGDVLPELIQAQRVVPVSKLGFDFQGAVTHSQETEPKETMNISLTQANMEVLDQLVRSMGAGSRNELIVTALKHFKQTREEKDAQ